MPAYEKSRRLVVFTTLLAALSTGCMSPPAAPPHPPVIVTTAVPSHLSPPPNTAEGYPQLGGGEPGSLIAATEFDTVDPNIRSTGATAWRVRYVSTSAIGDRPVEVTGLVVVPGGQAPDAGWQVVAFNHPNTGISPNCGPSLYEDLHGQWGPISLLLIYGFAVVMTDYEGLGGNGPPAFLNSAALGRNVIDGVRAARHLRPDIGSRWATFGDSLGGLAAWAANEQATTYGTDLDLVGAAAWAPLVNVSELPSKARDGTLTRDQLSVYFQAIMAMKATTHPEIDLQRYIHGAMYDQRDLLLICNSTDAAEAMKRADPADLVPVDDAAEQQMTQLLTDIAVPQQPTAAPMLVIYTTADPLVEQAWVETAINRACAMGDTIEWMLRPGLDDDEADALRTMPWVRDRFDNQAPSNQCPGAPVRS